MNAKSPVLKFKALKKSCFLMAALLFFSIVNTPAQGIFAHWINKTGGSVPESSIGAAMDIGTNVYILGRFYDYTNKIGATTLTNLISVSNLFLTKFTGNAISSPPWAKTAVTELPVSRAKLASDGSGNCIVAGSFGGTNLSFGSGTLTNYETANDHSEDIFVAKFNSSGVFGWLIQAGGSGDDTFGDMAIDQKFPTSSGFYLTGSFQSTNFAAGSTSLTRQSTNGSDCFVVKYNLNGSLLWIQQGAYAAGKEIAVDTLNNCYVGGLALGAAVFDGLNPSNQTTASFLAKYDNTGTLLWVRGDVPVGNQLYADKFQNIYTIGTFSNVLQFGNATLSNNSPSTIFVGKCDTNGTPLWAQQLPGWGYDGVSGITIDSAGNCWVAGYFASTNQTIPPFNSQAVIACYDSSGNLIATSQFGGAMASTATAATGAANNFFGNIAMSGTFATNFVLNQKYAVTNSGNSDIYAAVGGVLPQLKLTVNGTNVVCSWPVVNSTFTLQVLTNFSSSSWTTVGSGSMANGQLTVTNAASGNVKFFRLINNNP